MLIRNNNDEEVIIQYGVRGMKWGTSRAAKQVSKAGKLVNKTSRLKRKADRKEKRGKDVTKIRDKISKNQGKIKDIISKNRPKVQALANDAVHQSMKYSSKVARNPSDKNVTKLNSYNNSKMVLNEMMTNLSMFEQNL